MNKSISYQSGNLLFRIQDQLKRDWFTVADAASLMTDMKGGALRQLLSDMVKRGLLMKVKQGTYYLIPYHERPEQFLPDWHLLAEPLVGSPDYYIGYYSALQIHGLITQPSLNEYVITKKQVRPAMVNVRDIAFQFIYYNEQHYFGGAPTWIDDFNRVNCSDLEKTIIDCLYKPEYAGGIVEIAKAIYASKQKLKWPKLLDYCQKFSAHSVTKRLGYLLDLFDTGQEIIPALLELRTEPVITLDTELPAAGPVNKKWRVQENIDTETIISAQTT